jgi:hypothetical protein
MNTLELLLREYRDPEDEDEFVYLFVETLVDGVQVSPFGIHRYATDLSEFEKSLAHDGKFYIITCSCGFPECIGARAIVVKHLGDIVRWKVNLIKRIGTFEFTRSDYQKAWDTVIEQGNALITSLLAEGKRLAVISFQSERYFRPIPREKSESIFEILFPGSEDILNSDS